MKTLLVLSSLLLATVVQAQITATRLIPPGLTANSRLGITSRSLAVGGGKIAVGAPYHGDSGAVFVFDEKTGKYLYTLDHAANQNIKLFGWSVAISRNRLVIGAPWTDSQLGIKTGAAFVYDLNTRRELQFIQGPDYDANDEWGYSVAVEGDLIALGGPYAGASQTGAVELWKVGESTAEYRVDSTGLMLAAGDRFGQAIDLERGLLAIGAPRFAAQGRVWLYDALSNTLITAVEPHPSVVRTPLEDFGAALDIGSRYLVVGAPGAGNPVVGRVSTFDVSLLPSFGFSGTFLGTTGYQVGDSVAATHLGRVAGSPDADLTGTVRRTDTNSSESFIAPLGLTLGDSYGVSMALSGTTLFVTAPGDDTSATNAGTVWKLTQAVGLSYPQTNVRVVTGMSMQGTGSATLSSIHSAVDGPVCLMIGSLTGGDAMGEKKQAAWGYKPGEFWPLLARTGIPALPQLRLTALSHVTSTPGNTTICQWIRATRAGPGITSSNNQLYRRLFNGVEDDTLATGAATASGRLRAFTANGRANNSGPDLVVPVTYTPGAGLLPATSVSDTGYVFASAGITGELREGLSNAPGTALAIGQASTRFCYRDGRLTTSYFIQGAPTAANAMVQSGPLGVAIQVAIKGGPAVNHQGGPTTSFSAFLGEVNADQRVLIRATTALSPASGITTANNEGLWTASMPGPLALSMRKGDPVSLAGIGIGNVARIIEYGITRKGVVFALVRLSGPRTTAANDMALVASFTGGPIELLLREGDLAPGCEGARIGTLLSTDFVSSDAGFPFYTVLATLVVETGGANARNNLAQFTGILDSINTSLPSLRRPWLKLRKGSPAVTPAEGDNYTSFSLPCVVRDASGALDTGLGSSGSSLLRATLPDGRQCIVK